MPAPGSLPTPPRPHPQAPAIPPPPSCRPRVIGSGFPGPAVRPRAMRAVPRRVSCPIPRVRAPAGRAARPPNGAGRIGRKRGRREENGKSGGGMGGKEKKNKEKGKKGEEEETRGSGGRGYKKKGGPGAMLDGNPQHMKRRRATLPHPLKCSTIAVQGLSFRVRNGTGRLTLAMVAANLIDRPRTMLGGIGP